MARASHVTSVREFVGGLAVMREKVSTVYITKYVGEH